jgi:hypothetical protein
MLRNKKNYCVFIIVTGVFKNKDPACDITLEIYSGMLRIKFLFDHKFSG